MRLVQVGSHQIGDPARPAMVIAEAGVNHNGELSLAHQLVDAAAEAGADAVKFQTFSASEVVIRGGETAHYQQVAGGGADQRAMLERLELPVESWAALRDHATQRGLVFLSTAFDAASLHLLVDLGIDAVKVPSGELTNFAYLELHARCGLPVLASTGMASMAEVDSAVEILARSGAGLALFHCVSAYPTPVEASNLRAIPTMRNRHDVPVGWSDHTTGSVTAIAARAVGAAMFEKHLTLDRTMSGPDHAASADPTGFADYVKAIRSCEAALGSGRKEPAAVELENRNIARRSYYARSAIEAHESFTSDNVDVLRPVRGIPASERITGRRAARAIAAGAPIEWDDLV